MAAKKKSGKKGGADKMPKAPPMSVSEPTRELPARIRKNMDIDAVLLASARRALGASTDTEAVNRALAEVSRMDEILGVMDALRDAGGLMDVFGRLEG